MKAIAMVAAAFLSAVIPMISTDHTLSLSEWINVAIIGVGAAQVYIGANLAGSEIWSWTKAIMSCVTVGAIMLVSALSDGGVSPVEIQQVIIAILGAISVAALPGPPMAATAPVSGGRHEK